MPNFDLGPEYNQVKAFSQVNIICESAEQKIRAAMNATTAFGKEVPISVEHNGNKVHFHGRIDKLPSGKEQVRGTQPVIHLRTIRRGRLMSGMEPSLLVHHYVLDGKDNLKPGKTLPRQATEEESTQFFKDHGIEVPKKG
jgi:hypothetical protein